MLAFHLAVAWGCHRGVAATDSWEKLGKVTVR